MISILVGITYPVVVNSNSMFTATNHVDEGTEIEKSISIAFVAPLAI